MWQYVSIVKADGNALAEEKGQQRWNIATSMLISVSLADAAKAVVGSGKLLPADAKYVFHGNYRTPKGVVTHADVSWTVTGEQINARLKAIASGDIRRIKSSRVPFPKLVRETTELDYTD